MKNLSNFFLLALLSAAVMFVGCDGANDDVVEPKGPTVTLEAGTSSLGAEFVTAVDTVAPGDTFAISIAVDSGTSVINRIEVREDGIAMEPGRLVFDGDAAQSNPNPVASAGDFTWEILVETPSEEGTYTYEVIISDSSALTASASVEVTTVTPATPVSTATMYLLKNAGGPSGQGGLDVDTGDPTGTTTGNFTAADIRDQGIDLNQPVASNWIQKIAPINGTDLRAAATGTVWDDIETVEDITVAFEAATPITDESEKVAIGDIFFVVSTEGATFALVVTDIDVTDSNNADFYEFSVKF